MDAFERFVAVALEADAFHVYEDVRLCAPEGADCDAHDGSTQAGCDVAIVAARSDRLVLAMVRSLRGSRGVVAEHVTGVSGDLRCRKRYELLNDRAVRAGVLEDAGRRFGYDAEEIVLRLYVAKFATHGSGGHEARVREWCAGQQAGAGPIEVIGVREVLEKVRTAARSDDRDDPVLRTLELLDASGCLALEPEPTG